MLKDKYGIMTQLVQICNKHNQYSQNKDVASRVMLQFSSGGFCGDTNSSNCSFVNTTIGPFFFISHSPLKKYALFLKATLLFCPFIRIHSPGPP